jgi:hypothetical protein
MTNSIEDYKRIIEANEIIKRLDRIIELLELQTFIPEDAIAICQHEKAIDVGTMGTPPGERMYCPQCNQHFSRKEQQ